MNKPGFTYWQDGEIWLGHLDEYPDYLTQGNTLAELKENLTDLYQDLTSGVIPCVRRHAELELA
ncbi:MAG: type II toxin-antitoxin system HicB family antitoxin [Verrucomicrobiota bacterium]